MVALKKTSLILIAILVCSYSIANTSDLTDNSLCTHDDLIAKPGYYCICDDAASGAYSGSLTVINSDGRTRICHLEHWAPNQADIANINRNIGREDGEVVFEVKK